MVGLFALFLLLSGSGYAQVTFVSPPLFSHESGFFTEDFELSITHESETAVIYVTFDGSVPGLSSTIADEPFTISDASSRPNYYANIPTTLSTHPPERHEEPSFSLIKANIVRTVAVETDGSRSEVVSHSYFVLDPSEVWFDLPVFSIIIDPDDFFDDETGIYVPGNLGNPGDFAQGNYAQRGDEWEREGKIEFFSNQQLVHAQNVGFRIHGGWSRRFAQKSLRVYTRNQYEDRVFPVEFFKGSGVQPYRRFLLRNSGSEWGNQASMFRDGLSQTLISHLNQTTQEFQPSVVFINGEYWGIHNIRERLDRHYLERNYGIDPDNVDILEANALVKEGSNADYLDLMNFVRNTDLSADADFEELHTRMDIENYLDYYASQVYFGNNDWPHHNIDFWRLRVPYNPDAPHGHDGRWRWLTYDIDRSFGFFSNVNTNMIFWVTSYLDLRYSQVWPNELFRNMLENEGFKNDFVNRTADLLNTAFLPERVIGTIDSLAVILEGEIPRHIERWNRPGSVSSWHNQLSHMRSFAQNRPAVLRSHVREYFELGPDREITLEVSNKRHGFIRINSTDLREGREGVELNGDSWKGIYYDGVPVKLTAVPEFGYRFLHWETVNGIIENPEIVTSADGNATYFAVFEEIELPEITPEPIQFDENPHVFSGWSANATAGTFPENMAFVFMDQQDPNINAQISGFTAGAYNLTSRTRVNGLGTDGVSFINTGNDVGNPGYPGTRLGGALMAIDTRGVKNVRVSWSAGTVSPNSRVYHLRLQYRIGNDGPFEDLLDVNGNPVEYVRHPEAGHFMQMPDVMLPEIAEDRAYVQLFWRYYFTGAQLDQENGQRSELRLFDIRIEKNSDSLGVETDELRDEPESFVLMQAYPNPFNATTNIEVKFKENVDARLMVFDSMGRKISTLFDGFLNSGTHRFIWDAEMAASGVYLIVAETNQFTEILKVTLMK